MSVYIDGYLIDVFISEQPVKAGQVTRYPIEEGASIADHVIEAPERLTVTGIVSNNPMGATFEARDKSSTTPNASGLGADLLPFPELPANEAYSRLAKIKSEYKLVTVIGSTRTFDNMLLISLSDPRSGTTGDALEFTAVFEQITTINVKTRDRFTQVELPRHEEKNNKGSKPSPPVTPKEPKTVTDSKESTILKGLVDGLIK